jgi:hypothetical protein
MAPLSSIPHSKVATGVSAGVPPTIIANRPFYWPFHTDEPSHPALQPITRRHHSGRLKCDQLRSPIGPLNGRDGMREAPSCSAYRSAHIGSKPVSQRASEPLTRAGSSVPQCGPGIGRLQPPMYAVLFIYYPRRRFLNSPVVPNIFFANPAIETTRPFPLVRRSVLGTICEAASQPPLRSDRAGLERPPRIQYCDQTVRSLDRRRAQHFALASTGKKYHQR